MPSSSCKACRAAAITLTAITDRCRRPALYRQARIHIKPVRKARRRRPGTTYASRFSKPARPGAAHGFRHVLGCWLEPGAGLHDFGRDSGVRLDRTDAARLRPRRLSRDRARNDRRRRELELLVRL